MKQEAAPVAFLRNRDEKAGSEYSNIEILQDIPARTYLYAHPPKVERGEDNYVSITLDGSTHTRLKSEWLALARQALASPPVEQVPREPTKAMYEAGMLIDAMSPADPWEALKLIWQAMYDAAPVEGRNKGES